MTTYVSKSVLTETSEHARRFFKDALKMTNQPSIEPITREELAEIVNFLCGAAPLDGVWYSCEPPKGQPRFWWRPKLRAALSASEAREKKLREALKEIATAKYAGQCPITSDPKFKGCGPETKCPRCGDFGWFETDKEYNPKHDGHCVEFGAASVARQALGE